MNRDIVRSGFFPGSRLDDQPHYVYTFWRGNKPLYVGCTNNLRRRMKEHGQSWPQLHRAATWIAWTLFDNREEGMHAEAERISKLMPPWNVRHNPGHARLVDAYTNWQAWLDWEAETDAFIARCERRSA